MKLIDLLSMIDECIHVVVVDGDRNELSYYDGRDSIDERYNNVDVKRIGLLGSVIEIEIDVLEGVKNV